MKGEGKGHQRWRCRGGAITGAMPQRTGRKNAGHRRTVAPTMLRFTHAGWGTMPAAPQLRVSALHIRVCEAEGCTDGVATGR